MRVKRQIAKFLIVFFSLLLALAILIFGKGHITLDDDATVVKLIVIAFVLSFGGYIGGEI